MAPGTDLDVKLSHLKTKIEAPNAYTTTSSPFPYKKLATSYTVYVDIKPKADYTDGAFIKIMSTSSSFTFTGSCSSEANTCVGVGQTGYEATCVNTTLDSGACVVDSAGSFVTLEHKGQILKTASYKIKATV